MSEPPVTLPPRAIRKHQSSNLSIDTEVESGFPALDIPSCRDGRDRDDSVPSRG